MENHSAAEAEGAISASGEITVHDFDPFRVTIQVTRFRGGS